MAESKSSKRKLLIGGIAGAIAVAAVTGSLQVFHFLETLKQHANTVNTRTVRSAALSYMKDAGAPPQSLGELVTSGYLAPSWQRMLDPPRDEYGNRLRYETRGSTFVLVSPGRGGEADEADPWVIRASSLEDGEPVTVCGDYSSDIVMSDRGVHTACYIK